MTLKEKLKTKIRNFIAGSVPQNPLTGLLHYLNWIPNIQEFQLRTMMLTGKSLCQNNSQRILERLSDCEFSVFSQWGEDGIIDWLIENLPAGNERFVEFGVENYNEANTRFLLANKNWKGLILDGNPDNMNYVRGQAMHWRHDLTAVAAMIDAENINDILATNGFTGEIGLLSIDIDGNDYWVWEKITVVDPRIVVCEYNPIFGDLLPVTIPYDPAYTRFSCHYSGLYFGASIKALQLLAKRKGYTFIGTCSNGINAFFVRDDLCGHLDRKIKNRVAYASRHRDSRNEKGALSFTAGMARTDLIIDMPVVNVETMESKPLKEMGEIFSVEWLSQLEKYFTK